MMRSFLVAAATLVVGCSGSPTYADDPRLDEVRRAFHCDRPANDTAEQACDALDRFAAAGAVSELSGADSGVFVGRVWCSDDDNLAFHVYAMGSPPPSEPDADGSHRPEVSLTSIIASFRPTPSMRQAAADTMRALRESHPAPASGPEGAMPATWEQWRARVGESPMRELSSSDGVSLLESPGFQPAWWDDAEPTSPFGFFRRVDRELLYVRPPTRSGPLGNEACVSRTYLLPD